MGERAITAQGSDIEEAIQKGLRRLGLSRTDVIIDVVDEGRKGLLGEHLGVPVARRRFGHRL